jgi:hypothetical protein
MILNFFLVTKYEMLLNGAGNIRAIERGDKSFLEYETSYIGILLLTAGGSMKF